VKSELVVKDGLVRGVNCCDERTIVRSELVGKEGLVRRVNCCEE
jgi:hypothetical protein